MSIGLIARLVRGERRAWVAEGLADRLPAGLDPLAIDLARAGADRMHAKQGRATCRLRLDGPGGSVSVYLKRHTRLPWRDRLAALVDPAGAHSPGAAEWSALARARSLGIAVPEPVAAGQQVGPWGTLASYLIVAELVGQEPLHEAIPELAARLTPSAFEAAKRAIVAEMATMTARLHAARCYHKDLYLCHFFLDPARPAGLTLIDLHRLGRHRIAGWRWRWKDLGQLLFSTYGVAGIDDRDRLRFWARYRRAVRMSWAGWQRRAIAAKAARYAAHNRSAGGDS